ncbi:MAG: hypothetical protein GNW80_09595 [Asgard group archaeon]|nr:hypothetical protein [Asgard group archaeon]
MAWYDFIFNLPNVSERMSGIIWATIFWFAIILLIAIIWIATARRKKGVDVSALAALASSEPMSEGAAASVDPREVMTILSIERVAASTALSAVKDARRSKRISSTVSDSLSSRYKARITKIDADLKRRSGAQEYQSLAESLESSRDRLRDQVMPPPTTPPPPTSGTPGIPPTAPPVPGAAPPRLPPTGPPTSGAPPSVPTIPSIPTGSPPTKPSSPIPIPPKIPPVSSTARPTTVVPPSVAPPTISTPPLPPRLPTQSPVAPPTTSDMAPPPVPTSAPTTSATPATDSDGQTISGLRMEMLRELARLKKFMSEETQ